MNEHRKINDLLPFYVAGSLEPPQRSLIEQHIASCTECQADLKDWQSVSGEVTAANHSLTLNTPSYKQAIPGAVAPRRIPVWQHAWQILISQIPLVRREIWPASAAVMALGLAISFIGVPAHILPFLAPLIAAAGVAVIYGPEHDPAFELVNSTPSSPRQILLARLALVFGYNLAVALAASLLLTIPLAAPNLPGEFFGGIVLSWLAPMAFLSSLALLLSLVIGSGSAVVFTYLAWIIKAVAENVLSSEAAYHWTLPYLGKYTAFWANNGLLLALSALLVLLALWRAGLPAPDRSWSAA
jgi:hypothetical protein